MATKAGAARVLSAPLANGMRVVVLEMALAAMKSIQVSGLLLSFSYTCTCIGYYAQGGYGSMPICSTGYFSSAGAYSCTDIGYGV